MFERISTSLSDPMPRFGELPQHLQDGIDQIRLGGAFLNHPIPELAALQSPLLQSEWVGLRGLMHIMRYCASRVPQPETKVSCTIPSLARLEVDLYHDGLTERDTSRSIAKYHADLRHEATHRQGAAFLLGLEMVIADVETPIELIETGVQHPRPVFLVRATSAQGPTV